MYFGEIVETAGVKELFENPRHPYTKGLMGCIPKLDEDEELLNTIPGMVPAVTEHIQRVSLCPPVSPVHGAVPHREPELGEIAPGHACRCWQRHGGESMSRLLEVSHLSKFYTNKKGLFKGTQETVKAVNDISFFVEEQETLGIVGESGCGKSTTGRAVLRLHEPTAGEVRFRGTDILHLSQEELRPYRQKMQIVFQNANSALDPRWTVERSLKEPILLH